MILYGLNKAPFSLAGSPASKREQKSGVGLEFNVDGKRFLDPAAHGIFNLYFLFFNTNNMPLIEFIDLNLTNYWLNLFRQINKSRPFKETKWDDGNTEKLNMAAPQTVQILTNQYNPDDPDTDYNELIKNPDINNGKVLFIFYANLNNCGYKGGSGGGSANIGNEDNAYGLMTGLLNGFDNGFKALDKFVLVDSTNETRPLPMYFKNGWRKLEFTTPKQMIDYNFIDLNDIIAEKGYTHIIIPTDESRKNIDNSIFNVADSVKRYIIAGLSKFQPIDKWKPLSEYIAQINATKTNKIKNNAPASGSESELESGSELESESEPGSESEND